MFPESLPRGGPSPDWGGRLTRTTCGADQGVRLEVRPDLEDEEHLTPIDERLDVTLEEIEQGSPATPLDHVRQVLRAELRRDPTQRRVFAAYFALLSAHLAGHKPSRRRHLH